VCSSDLYGLAALVVHAGGTRAAAVFSAVALLGYWALLSAFGDLTLKGNAVLRFDLWLLGERHLYRGEGIPFDPEGTLSTLPSVVNVLAGWWAGQFLRREGARWDVVARLLMAGLAAIAVAWGWDSELPFNKKLWTSSYALVTSGIAMVVLAVLVERFQLAPLRPRWGGFFEVFGRNTLALYLLAELAMAVLWLTPVGSQTAMMWLYENGFARWAGEKPGSLLFALAFMLACWSVGWWMDRRRIYIRL
jgi:predicted acyltransferase